MKSASLSRRTSLPLLNRPVPSQAGAVCVRGVRPGEVVEPGARGDVAENRAAIDVADLAGAVNVVEQFVIVGGVKRWNMPVPLAEVASALEINFVVFPHPDDSRYFGRCRVLGQARRCLPDAATRWQDRRADPRRANRR